MSSTNLHEYFSIDIIIAIIESKYSSLNHIPGTESPVQKQAKTRDIFMLAADIELNKNFYK